MTKIDTTADHWNWLNRVEETQRSFNTPEYLEGSERAQTFTVNKRQQKQIRTWVHPCPFTPTEDNPYPGGAIGGVLTYTFTNTSLGQVLKVLCACGQSLDVSDYQEW